MEPFELNEQVRAKLLEFDSLDAISASEKWDTALEIRLEILERYQPKKNLNYGLFFLSLLLINGFIMMYSLVDTPEKDTVHVTNLQVISNEILITSN